MKYRYPASRAYARTSSGMGFLGWLQILFIGLKLTNYISWPWLWVLSPLWGSLSLFLVTALAILVIYIFIDK